MLIVAERAESGFGAEVFHFIDAIFDEIGRLDLLHFELGFRTVEFGEKRFEEAIAFGSGVRGDHSGVRRGFRIGGGCAQGACVQSEQSGDSKMRNLAKGLHGFTSLA
jgi:hypothetical protein